MRLDRIAGRALRRLVRDRRGNALLEAVLVLPLLLVLAFGTFDAAYLAVVAAKVERAAREASVALITAPVLDDDTVARAVGVARAVMTPFAGADADYRVDVLVTAHATDLTATTVAAGGHGSLPVSALAEPAALARASTKTVQVRVARRMKPLVLVGVLPTTEMAVNASAWRR